MNLRYSSLRPVALALVIMLAGVDTALASSSQTQQTDINAAATPAAQSPAPQNPNQNQRPMAAESVSPLQQTPLPPPQGLSSKGLGDLDDAFLNSASRDTRFK